MKNPDMILTIEMDQPNSPNSWLRECRCGFIIDQLTGLSYVRMTFQSANQWHRGCGCGSLLHGCGF